VLFLSVFVAVDSVWNETFSRFKLGEVSHLDRLRFEVWDKDFLSKDFMGMAEVSVAEIREKQLIERKVLPTAGRNSVGQDYTQEPVSFHLKLQPLEGRKNEGRDAVSGHIDVRIRYFKLSGAMPAPAAKGGAAAAAAGASDELDFGIEHVGQTGSKRPRADSAGRGSAVPLPSPTAPLSRAASHSDVSHDVADPAAAAAGAAAGPVPAAVPVSSTTVFKAIEAKQATTLWSDIGAKLKAVTTIASAASATAPAAAGTAASSTSAAASAAAALSSAKPSRGSLSQPAAKRFATLRSTNAILAASPAPGGAAATAGNAPAEGAASRKTLKKSGDSQFNIFKLF